MLLILYGKDFFDSKKGFADCMTYIGYCAFKNCTSLTSINLPDCVTYIDEDAFSGCTNLKNVTYKGKSYSYDNIDELYSAIGQAK